MKNTHLGFTLVELMMVISILMTLGLSAPSFHRLITSHKDKTSLDNLYRLSQYAHSLAITEGKTITVCGSKDGINCIKNWKKANVVVFSDSNNNKKIDSSDHIFKSMAVSSTTVRWRGSNRNYMRFHPEGYAIEWGRYSICPHDSNNHTVKQLVFNRMGRAYQKSVALSEKKYQKLCKKA